MIAADSLACLLSVLLRARPTLPPRLRDTTCCTAREAPGSSTAKKSRSPTPPSDGAAAQAARARLDALERDKLEQYQRKYEEYVKVSRALGALTDTPTEVPRDAGT